MILEELVITKNELRMCNSHYYKSARNPRVKHIYYNKSIRK